MKSVGHWILFILKAITALLLLPFGLLYAWIRWRIARRAFIRAAEKTGMDKSSAKLLAGELAPHNLIGDNAPFINIRKIV